MTDVKGYEDYFRIGYGELDMPKALTALIDFVEMNKANWQ